MGYIVDQDRAYTTAVLNYLLAVYEEEWEELSWAMLVHSICAVIFLLVLCLGGIRSYDVVWTNLGALRYDLTYCGDLQDKSAVSWPVVGRFKARGGVADCHRILIAGPTQPGKIFFEWTRRFVVR